MHYEKINIRGERDFSVPSTNILFWIDDNNKRENASQMSGSISPKTLELIITAVSDHLAPGPACYNCNVSPDQWDRPLWHPHFHFCRKKIFKS